MSDTPRTDACLTDQYRLLARQLERELGEAQKKVADYSDAYAMLENKNVGIEQDRDAWRKVAEESARCVANFVQDHPIDCCCEQCKSLQHFTQLQKEKE